MRSLGRLFSLFGTQPTSALCLAFTSACRTTSTTVTSARYPTKASTIITYALSPKSSVYILLHRNGLDGLPASVQFDDDSAHINSHITRYADGVCRRMPKGLICKNDDEGSRSDVRKRQNCTASYQHLTFPSVSHFLSGLTSISPYQTASQSPRTSKGDVGLRVRR